VIRVGGHGEEVGNAHGVRGEVAGVIARVVSNQVRAGRSEDWLALIRDVVVPSLEQQPGFRGFAAFTSPHSSKTIGFSLWEDEASLTASEASGDYQRQIGKLAAVLAEPPVRELYEYVVVAWLVGYGIVILIVVKHQVRPAHAAGWRELMADFTAATRAEPGAISFDWARSLDDPNEILLIEAFTDPAAGTAHVNSDHFKSAVAGNGLAVTTDSCSAR
jgi:quinol monooxygenase YgiN